MQPRTWRDAAKCAGTDPDLFFPPAPSAASREQVAAAKAICAECPVIEPCLRAALELGSTVGVWGGTTEEERARLRRVLALRGLAPGPVGR